MSTDLLPSRGKALYPEGTAASRKGLGEFLELWEGWHGYSFRRCGKWSREIWKQEGARYMKALSLLLRILYVESKKIVKLTKRE